MRAMVVRLLTVSCLIVLCASPLPSPPRSVEAAEDRREKVDGYAEWKKTDLIVVDGQRVRAGPETKIRPKNIRDVRSIPLGYEVEAKGVRDATGILVAESIEVKPNGAALFEKEVNQATNEMEAVWLQNREVSQPRGDGGVARVGRILDTGPDVQRLQRITTRLTPPYIPRDNVRVHVIETKDWNAMAMGNGAVWVYTGLLHDMDDDEVAIVVGHELAHYTHEHSRRGMRRAMWTQLIAAGVIATAESLDSNTARQVLGIAGGFSLMAWQNGYGRDLEDQADRVGLRYAYEGGYNVAKGPRVWRRFRDKYGAENRVTNFFFSNHSVAEVREKNLAREISLNYPEFRGR